MYAASSIIFIKLTSKIGTTKRPTKKPPFPDSTQSSKKNPLPKTPTFWSFQIFTQLISQNHDPPQTHIHALTQLWERRVAHNRKNESSSGLMSHTRTTRDAPKKSAHIGSPRGGKYLPTTIPLSSGANFRVPVKERANSSPRDAGDFSRGARRFFVTSSLCLGQALRTTAYSASVRNRVLDNWEVACV